jgi:hypothetical protein
MRGLTKVLVITMLCAVAIYFGLGYLSSYVGWYGKWLYRVHSSGIKDSKSRGVFVKELSFKIENYPGTLDTFKPFIERGFKFGRHSSDETAPLTGSAYPYQLSFNFTTSQKIGLLIMREELKKFDSSDAVWGYLASPNLRDTIIVSLVGEYGHAAFVKVWQ